MIVFNYKLEIIIGDNIIFYNFNNPKTVIINHSKTKVIKLNNIQIVAALQNKDLGSLKL